MLVLLVLVAMLAGSLSSAKIDVKNKMNKQMIRRILDRACNASEETLSEVVGCFIGNRELAKSVKAKTATECFKEAYGANLEVADMFKSRDVICNQRDKFDLLTECMIERTTANLNKEQADRVNEAFVDVGLCIVDALDE